MPIRKKSGYLSYAPRIYHGMFIIDTYIKSILLIVR